MDLGPWPKRSRRAFEKVVILNGEETQPFRKKRGLQKKEEEKAGGVIGKRAI